METHSRSFVTRVRQHPSWIALGAAAILGPTGCGSSTEPRHGEILADARKQATNAFAVIDQFPWHTTPEDYAHLAAQIDGVEVMKAVDSEKYAGSKVTIRVHGRASVSVPDRDDGGTIDTAPFRYIVGGPVCYDLVFGDRDRGAHGEVPCPDTKPLRITKDPVIPDEIDDLLKIQLANAADDESVRQVVDDLDLPQGVTRDVASRAGIFGIALSASRYQCRLARRISGLVQTWRPSQPPEQQPCSAATAIEGQRDPG